MDFLRFEREGLMTRLTANANVAESVEGDKVDYLVELSLLGGIARLELPEAVEPDDLEDLLGSEECTDEPGWDC